MIDHLRNIQENPWFPINESIQNVFLQSLMVVFYTLTFAKGQRVVAVGENNGQQLLLIVYKMATKDARDRNFVLVPQ